MKRAIFYIAAVLTACVAGWVVGGLLFPPLTYAQFPVQSVPQGGTGWGNIQSGTVILGNGTTRLATTTRGNLTGDGAIDVSGGTNAVLGGNVSLTLNTSGDWTGTIDGFNGFSYPFPSNATTSVLTFSTGIIVGNSTTTSATTTSLAISGLNHALLSTNANGSVLATTSIGVNFLTGTLPIANGGTGATSLNNLITLTTHTTGNYVATLADDGQSTITVNNGSTEGGAATLRVIDVVCTDCLGATEIGGLGTADISGLDFSADLNTTATAPIRITGDDINFTGLATTSQPSSSNVLVSNGAAGVYGVATTSVSCSGTVSCSGFSVIGSGPITLTGSAGGTGLSSTTPWNVGELAYVKSNAALTSVATTSASCADGISCTAFTVIGSSPITIDGFTYPFPSAATSTFLTFTGGILGNNASSTITNLVTVNGSSTNATTTNLAISGLTHKLLATNATGVVVSTTSIGVNYLTGVLGTANIAGLDISDDTNLAATAPIRLVGDTLSFTGLATTSQPTSSNVITSNGAAGVYGTATSSVTFSAPLTTSGTPGALLGGSALTVDIDDIAATDLANADFGDFSCNGTTCTVDANAIALTTDTTGNYVETITGTAKQVAVSGSGAEDADVTLSLPAHIETTSALFGSASTTNATTTNLHITSLNCTSNANGGALTADANGLISCSDDNSAGGGAGLASSSPWAAGQLAAVVDNASVVGTSTPTVNNIISTSSAQSTFVGGLTVLGWDVGTTSAHVCKQGAACNYTVLQTAIDDNWRPITLGQGTFSEQITIANTKTKIQGTSLLSIVQFNGATQSPGITSNAKDETHIEGITVNESGALPTRGITLDLSNSSLNRILFNRFNDAATSTLFNDTANGTFYTLLMGNTFFGFGDAGYDFSVGSQANAQNSAFNRLRPAQTPNGGYGFKFGNTRGFASFGDNIEGTTTSNGVIAIDIASTTRDISIFAPWIEANTTGVACEAGFSKVGLFGGSVTSNGTDIDTDCYGTLTAINVNVTGNLLNTIGTRLGVATTTSYNSSPQHVFGVTGASLFDGNITIDGDDLRLLGSGSDLQVDGGATSTTLFATTASTTNFFGAGLTTCTSNNVLTWSGGKFGCEADDQGAGGSFPFTTLTHYGTTTNATTTGLWAKMGIYASSTSYFEGANFNTDVIFRNNIDVTNTANFNDVITTGTFTFGADGVFLASESPGTVTLTANSGTGGDLRFDLGGTPGEAIITSATPLSTTTFSALSVSAVNGYFSGHASTSRLTVSSLNSANCDVKASTTGVLSCGTDSTGSATWPWTPTTVLGTSTQATTTSLWLRSVGLYASSSVVGFATTSNATTTALGFTGIANALLAANASGNVIASTSIGINLTTLTGGRSTTLTGANLDADSELYTFTIGTNLVATSSTSGISTTSQALVWVQVPTASTITGFECGVAPGTKTGTSTIRAVQATNAVGAGASEILYSTGVQCGSSMNVSTSTFSDTSIGASDWIGFWVSDAEPTGSRPGRINVSFTATKDD